LKSRHTLYLIYIFASLLKLVNCQITLSIRVMAQQKQARTIEIFSANCPLCRQIFVNIVAATALRSKKLERYSTLSVVLEKECLI
jgi:hypothetical protein